MLFLFQLSSSRRSVSRLSITILPSFLLRFSSHLSMLWKSPCGFGVRIVPLYPPACRKRRLKGGVHGSLVVTFMAARCQCPRFYPGQGRNLDRDFCSMCTYVPPLGSQHRVPEPVPSLETHLKGE